MNRENTSSQQRFRVMVLGVSTGGVEALKRLLPALPAAYPLSLLVVTHISPESGDGLAHLLDGLAQIHVKEADEGELITPGVAYLAPANYHLLLESDRRLALSTDPQVNFARPSVDVLFESAAACFGSAVIGVILTGAGTDGALGLERIKQSGGISIVQDPDDAVMDSMPRSALERSVPDFVATLDELPALLVRLATPLVATQAFARTKPKDT